MSMSAESKTALKTSPVWPTVIILWATALVFAFYDPASVRDQIQKSERLSEQAWLVQTLVGVQKASDSIGFPKMRAALDRLRSGLNAPYTLFDRPSKDPEPASSSNTVSTSSTTAELVPVETSSRSHRLAKAKSRILVVGASSIQFAIGTELERRLPKYEGVKVLRFGKLASGLSRPDFFDWPKQIRKLVTQFKPDLIIANFGGNGAQAIPLGDYKEAKFRRPKWDQEYTRRVQEVVSIGHTNGADVVFLGMPNMRSKKFAKKMRYLNKIQKEAAEASGAIWISTWAYSSGPKGEYRKSIRIGKKRGLMRTSDGVHYSRLGAKFVIENVMQQLEQEFYLIPGQANRATSRKHVIEWPDSKVQLEFLEYRPRGSTEKWPYLVITSTSTAEHPKCPQLAHRKLQTQAQKHQAGFLVIKPCGHGLPTKALHDDFVSGIAEKIPAADPVKIMPMFDGTPKAFAAALEAELKLLRPDDSSAPDSATPKK